MDLQEEDGQITEGHSIRNLRRDSRQTFIDGTSFTAKDVLETPEILDLVLQNATPEGALDYSSLLRAPLKFSTGCQKLRDIAIMVRDYVIRYAREHPYLLALNIGLMVAGFAVPLLLGDWGLRVPELLLGVRRRHGNLVWELSREAACLPFVRVLGQRGLRL
ncbi:hypothetical protein B9Z19DRAFT_1197299 [Tuber borchii]|uniref:Uncharacterized protein n=1 Tax=Tuber borchii TaxID=42251 RepID=A0A2T6ZBK3_TUBBO|nr:hypothetical protein B9Z19DRAFT_1197299 [Tuber borchii]